MAGGCVVARLSHGGPGEVERLDGFGRRGCAVKENAGRAVDHFYAGILEHGRVLRVINYELPLAGILPEHWRGNSSRRGRRKRRAINFSMRKFLEDLSPAMIKLIIADEQSAASTNSMTVASASIMAFLIVLVWATRRRRLFCPLTGNSPNLP